VLLYPGVAMGAAGLLVSAALLRGPLRLGAVTLDVHTLLVSSTSLSTGVFLILLAITARAYASRLGLLPSSLRLEAILDKYSLGIGIAAGLVLSLMGFAFYVWGLLAWGENSFGPITHYQTTLRLVISGTTLITLGAEVFFGSFVLSIFNLHDAHSDVAAAVPSAHPPHRRPRM
jgi:hypothetical protein